MLFRSALSIQLAQHFNSEIISADSRQFYKELKIGATPPSQEELIKVKHHFIQHLSVKDDYNVGLFEKDAIAVLYTLFKKTDTLIMAGGSGLYIDARSEEHTSELQSRTNLVCRLLLEKKKTTKQQQKKKNKTSTTRYKGQQH